MKRVLFILLVILSTNIYANEKCYVVKNDTTILGVNYKANQILGITDAKIYLFIEEDVPQLSRRHAIPAGTICPITQDNSDPTVVKFKYNNQERSGVLNSDQKRAKVSRVYKVVTNNGDTLAVSLDKGFVSTIGDNEVMKHDFIEKCQLQEDKYRIEIPINCTLYFTDVAPATYQKGEIANLSVLNEADSISVYVCNEEKKLAYQPFALYRSDLPIPAEIPIWKKNIVWLILGTVLFVIVIIVCICMWIRKRRVEDDERNKQVENITRPNLKEDNLIEVLDNKECETNSIIDGSILKHIADSTGDISAKIGGISMSLDEITNKNIILIKNIVESVQSTLNNVARGSKDASAKLEEEKKRNEELKSKLEAAKVENDKLKVLNDSLKAENESLKNFNGALYVPDSNEFVISANKFLRNCRDAENSVMRFLSECTSSDSRVIKDFVVCYHVSRPSVAILRWSGIIATLELKSLLNDHDYCPMMQKLPENERINNLKKYFFEDVLRPYLSSILVLLEKCRKANEYGIGKDVSSYNFGGHINSIVTLAKEEKIDIDYRKLFEPVPTSGYDKLEVATDIPSEYAEIMNKYPTDVVIYVYDYAINSSISSTSVKTKCVIKL